MTVDIKQLPYSTPRYFFQEYLSFLPLQVSSFNKSDCLDFIANDEWPRFTQPQSTGLSGLRAMLESYHKLQPKLKSVPRFKDTPQLILFALSEKAIDSTLKDYCKRLQIVC